MLTLTICLMLLGACAASSTPSPVPITSVPDTSASAITSPPPNMKGINTFALFDDQVFEKGWIAIGFADPTLKIITKANHGFNVLQGMQLEVTRSESNSI